MNRRLPADTGILVASDKTEDAALVKKLLDTEFGKVCTSTDPDQTAADFDRNRPDVLVLAFDSIEKSERHNLGLYRHSATIHVQPHRTIVLCGKEEVQRAFRLCREGIFDDYVLFWPMTHDAPRLSMSVHLALRELAGLAARAPSAEEFAAQARRLATLEEMLSQQMARGEEHIESVGRAVAGANEDAGAAFDAFSQRLEGDELPERVGSVEGLRREIGRLKSEAIDAPLHSLSESVQPLARWAGEFREATAPHMESVRALNALAGEIKPTVLVVDDDAFQRKIIGSILEGKNRRLLFAASGIEALSIVRETRPDLILMDVMLPGIDGVEVLRTIKAVPRLAGIPVVMTTGRSEKDIVMKSLKAGASGFLVKPLARDALLARVREALPGS